MSNKSLKELTKPLVLSSLSLTILSVILMDPFDFRMSDMAHMLATGLLLASFAVFAGLLWKERAEDERESQIIDQGGRFSYLVGMSALITALVFQSFDHNVDGWLVATITVMIVSKQAYVHLKK